MSASKKIFEVSVTTDGDEMQFRVGYSQELDETEWIGLFDTILSWVHDDKQRREHFTIAQLHFLEKQGIDILDKFFESVEVDKNAIS
jgi:hypothetical protein